ncbi:hypothetical protein [Streptomyces sp. B6B3]|uniref:hypothetical protein n=1 Tax=Streptomyces sp. B6B3 TaxID=3153570 RepID=UPI00325E721B
MARVDRIAEPWGSRTPSGAGEPWPVRADSPPRAPGAWEEVRPGPGAAPEDVDRWARTASVPHSNGDALDVAVRDTPRQARWANAELREPSPRILVS